MSSIQVFVRCRPLIKSECNAAVPVEVYPELNKVIVRDTGLDKSTVKTFSYDKVFGPDTTQAEIYSEVVAPLVEEVIQGFNCTIFAYGQTGTGKTFTIEGDRTPNLQDKSDDPLSGIIPRSMKHLFDELSIQNLESTRICVSFLELYNEEIFDLLSKHDNFIKLRMYENSSQKGSVIVQGLEIVTVKSIEEVYAILEKGFKRRRKAVTLLNKASSRSHTIFTVTVCSKERSTTLEKLKNGKLNLVDLAGSENIGRSGAINKRAREAGNINQSLLALGRVITSLCEKASHIPYRESKLTRLLQDSLGGQTKTAVIATISPSALHIEETLNTLEYALRAKSITNRPELNAQLTVNSIVQDHLEKINSLRDEIYQAAKKNGGVYVPEEIIRKWEANLEENREEKFKLLSQVKCASEEDKRLDATILDLKRRLEAKEYQLGSAKSENENLKQQLEKKMEEHKFHQNMLDIMQPMQDCLHEKFHKTLEELKTLKIELKKKQADVDEVLEEQRKAVKSIDEIRSNHRRWNENFRKGSDKVMNDIRNMNDSVKFVTSECKNLASTLKNGFDSRKLDCENVFYEVILGIGELETISNDFQKNIEACLLEGKSKLKSIEDIETEYLSSTKGAELELLNQSIAHCESKLCSLSSAAKEWENELNSVVESRRNLMTEHGINMKNILETAFNNVKYLLNKQGEHVEEVKKIVSVSLNGESTSRNMVLDKFEAAEEAVKSLGICCSKANEDKVYKIDQAHSSLKNYLDVGNEIVEKFSSCGEEVVRNTDRMQIEARNLPNTSSEKWKKWKEEEDSAVSRYTNLIEEVKNITPIGSDIPDVFRRYVIDIDESNEQLKISKCVQMMADSVIERGNNFVSRMYKNHSEIAASLSEDEINTEKLLEYSRRLSEITTSQIAYNQHFLNDDLLKRFEQTDIDGTVVRIEESFNGTNTMVKEETVCLQDAACEPQSQNFAAEVECLQCHRTMSETLKTGDFTSTELCRNTVKDKTEIPGSTKFSRSKTFGSPVKRPWSSSRMVARKNLQFPDAEKLAQELLENVCEKEE